MHQIELTRKAIKDLQQLQSTGSLKVPERLFEQLASTQEGEKFPHTIHLSGYPHLWRSRIDVGGGGSLRLIWTNNPENRSIRFLYVDQRDDDTYDFNLSELPQEPAYRWNKETGVEWSLFLNGAYNASPVLTQPQQTISNQVGKESNHTLYGEDQRIGFFAYITQSPPGTGKTITAALRACELYKAGWNVIFLVPQCLLEDVKSFYCIQSISSDLSQGFFCNTFQNWVVQFFPEFSSLVLPPEKELEILQDLANRAERSRQNLKFNRIELRDVILYQSFVLNPNENYSKNAVYQENKDRIEDLKYIHAQWWQEKIARLGKESRSTIANTLSRKWEDSTINLLAQERVVTILIVDEAQDYLIGELNVLKNFCRKLHQSGHPTHLWLLGDLNQRIMPVDFEWGALELVRTQDPGWKCFRNSSHILRFSNLFLTPVQENARKGRVRFPYKPGDPEKSYEIGERVKLISYPSESDAEDLLKKLAQSIGSRTREIEKGRSLIYKLASRVKVLKSESYGSKYKDELEILNVHEAKGREFDSCIVFNIFEFKGTEPISGDWWQWYTLLTRTRSRLLVIVTYKQYQLLLSHIPNILSECEHIDFKDPEAVDSVYQWIQAESNDLELSAQKQDLVERYLCNALQSSQPLIYWDTYEVLDQVGITGAKRTNFERKLLLLLREYSSEILQSELTLAKVEAKNPLIQCLLMRAMRQSWSAAYSIEALKEVNKLEYERVIQAISKELEDQKLFVESARIKFQKLNMPYPNNLPMPEVAQSEGNLLAALVNILKLRSYAK
jgi:mRNA-degrading endonuclease RelE of RelBE toxin-antitoxin system